MRQAAVRLPLVLATAHNELALVHLKVGKGPRRFKSCCILSLLSRCFESSLAQFPDVCSCGTVDRYV